MNVRVKSRDGIVSTLFVTPPPQKLLPGTVWNIGVGSVDYNYAIGCSFIEGKFWIYEQQISSNSQVEFSENGINWNHQEDHLPYPNTLTRQECIGEYIILWGSSVLFVGTPNLGYKKITNISTLIPSIKNVVFFNGKYCIVTNKYVYYTADIYTETPNWTVWTYSTNSAGKDSFVFNNKLYIAIESNPGSTNSVVEIYEYDDIGSNGIKRMRLGANVFFTTSSYGSHCVICDRKTPKLYVVDENFNIINTITDSNVLNGGPVPFLFDKRLIIGHTDSIVQYPPKYSDDYGETFVTAQVEDVESWEISDSGFLGSMCYGNGAIVQGSARQTFPFYSVN